MIIKFWLLDSAELIAQLRSKHADGKNTFGLDLYNGKNFSLKGARTLAPMSFLHGKFSCETDEYEKAESPLSNDTKIINFDHLKSWNIRLDITRWKYMIMYFQLEYFNFLEGSKSIILVSLERESVLGY